MKTKFLQALDFFLVASGEIDEKFFNGLTARQEWTLHDLLHASTLGVPLQRGEVLVQTVGRRCLELPTALSDMNEARVVALEILILRRFGLMALESDFVDYIASNLYGERTWGEWVAAIRHRLDLPHYEKDARTLTRKIVEASRCSRSERS